MEINTHKLDMDKDIDIEVNVDSPSFRIIFTLSNLKSQ
jgi:hypothetical protein